jgi:hypothetical protein
MECDCPWPSIDVLCRDRVPGARNPECPSLRGYGCENLTAEMGRWNARDEARRRLRQNFNDAHFGLTLGEAEAEPSKGVCDVRTLIEREEAWQIGAYLPARGI